MLYKVILVTKSYRWVMSALQVLLNEGMGYSKGILDILHDSSAL